MAWKKRPTRKYRSRGGGMYSAPKKRTSRKAVRSSKRYGAKRGYSRGSARGAVQTLRIELAPGLAAAQPGIRAVPIRPRRTKHF